MKPYVLIVEDEESISTLIEYNLDKADFETLVVDNGEKALDAVLERKPDIIIMDWMMPIVNGMEVCQQLRSFDKTRGIPIIMLTARGEEEDKIAGLNSGADDYIVKPFSPNELIARVKALLRRSSPILVEQKLEYAGINVNMANHKVTYNENGNSETLHLGPTEFNLLAHLVAHPAQIFSREQLLDSVWGHDVYVENRTVDVHIRRVRKALDSASDGLGSVIKTVRSAGYMIEI